MQTKDFEPCSSQTWTRAKFFPILAPTCNRCTLRMAPICLPAVTWCITRVLSSIEKNKRTRTGDIPTFRLTGVIRGSRITNLAVCFARASATPYCPWLTGKNTERTGSMWREKAKRLVRRPSLIGTLPYGSGFSCAKTNSPPYRLVNKYQFLTQVSKF